MIMELKEITLKSITVVGSKSALAGYIMARIAKDVIKMFVAMGLGELYKEGIVYLAPEAGPIARILLRGIGTVSAYIVLDHLDQQVMITVLCKRISRTGTPVVEDVEN
jgi:hypothetical protein